MKKEIDRPDISDFSIKEIEDYLDELGLSVIATDKLDELYEIVYNHPG